MIENKFFTITELTREFGITTRTLRFYEKEGLLHPAKRGRTRLYTPQDRRFLQDILRGRRIGFTLAEVADLVRAPGTLPEEVAQLNDLIARMTKKRDDLRQQRRDIDDMLAELDHLEEACVGRLAEIRVGS